MKLHQIVESGLKKTPSMKHDSDENAYVVYDSTGKEVERFWWDYSSDDATKNGAHRDALKKLRELRTSKKKPGANT